MYIHIHIYIYIQTGRWCRVSTLYTICQSDYCLGPRQ